MQHFKAWYMGGGGPCPENGAMVVPGEHQPGGVGPHTAHTAPTSPLPMLTAPASLEPISSLGKQANGDVKWSSRDTLTDWGSGRQGQPFHPLLKGHRSTDIPKSTKPLTRTQTPHFSYREEMKLQPSPKHPMDAPPLWSIL